MEKKYIFTNETITIVDRTLHRIKAVKDFEDVKAGDLGGFIEKEENLSHKGICWIYDEARVFDGACVYGEAHVYGEAYVYGEAHVYGGACVYDEARVFDKAYVYGEADVYGEARVCGEASISGNANITDQYDVLCIPNIGSRRGTTSFFKNRTGEIHVRCGCFTGTIEEFERTVEKTHGNNEHGKAYKLAVTMAKQYLHIV